MSFFLPSRNQTRELAPEGEHLAVCYSIIEFGTQPGYDGKERPELRLTWELIDKLNSEGWPLSISRTYNFSSHPASALILDLEAWRGQKLDERFDLESLIGQVALVNIQHKTGRNGDYAALTSVTQPPNGVARRRTPLTKQVVFSISNYDAEVYAHLPEWMQTKIAASPEYRIATGQEALPAVPEQRRQAVPSSSIRRELDDDIPF